MTKITTKLYGTTLALFFLSAGVRGYAGGGNASGELILVNTVTVSLAGVKNLSIDSADAGVIVRNGGTGELVIREYMEKDHPQYYARVSQAGETVNIRQGRRPWLFWLRETRIEIDLPRSFRENIRITHGSGVFRAETDFLDFRTIDLSVSSGLASFKRLSGETVSVRVSSGSLDVEGIEGNSFISVSSGKLQIGALTGGEHRIKESSGRTRIGVIRGGGIIDISSGGVIFEKTLGRMESHVSSGSLTMGDFSGEGSFDLNSGNIRLDIRELSGDLRFTVSSGDIDVNIPGELSFNLDAVTNSGSVLVNEGRDDAVRVSGNSSVLRPIGLSPMFTIYARISSGSVNIRRTL
jgi:hypothetical protein